MTFMINKNYIQSIDEVNAHHSESLDLIKLYQRVVNYLAAAQIYLVSNVLLQEPLKEEDIKPRLLGHWGTCPGINMIYAHLNRLIIQYDLDMFLVTGPGHGAPANLANLYMEGSLQKYYPQFSYDYLGLERFVRAFSWPDGFPSHLYAGLPGTIHEGGELGYALATAFGAVMDNPDLIVACIVGDGEAETGPTATAWHSIKFLDPVESGAVLPIVHINGYKISSPTIYGTMSDEELQHLFSGYGYQPRIVSEPDLDAGLFAAMDWAYHQISIIQSAARSGQAIEQARWPVILFRSPKGMGGIKEINGELIEGTWRSHQVPAKDCRTNPQSLKLVENWLRSYRPQELFDPKGCPIDKLFRLCPKKDKRMGCNPHAFGGKIRKPLQREDIHQYEIHLETRGNHLQRGQIKMSNVHAIVPLLEDVIRKNPDNFRIFSPDELESNKLNVFEVTQRDYQWPLKPIDTNIGERDGRVLEILSEHTCQGWMQGYALTGRYTLFPSYEAFFGIIATMVDQYAKFIKMSKDFPWRLPVPSLNYIATSTLWRQEHNGFSHQNPSFLNTLLNKKGETVRIYLPPDANCLISTMNHCLKSVNYVNLVIADKLDMPQWLTMDEAVHHCRAGASIWKWASTEDGIDPDIVLVGLGDDMTMEVLAAAQYLLEHLPTLRLRVINVTDLLVLESESHHPHGLDQGMFDALFTDHCPVIFNFHGYPSALKQLLFHRGDTTRFTINGYQEEGTTTTPFDMLVRNGVSRYHLIEQAIRMTAHSNPEVSAVAMDQISHITYVLRDHRRYIDAHGDDPDFIKNWTWDRQKS
jgi:xylulose-5-phosphate/fructose-6-phosphate phosphoketolase